MLLSRIETEFRFLHGTYGARVHLTNKPLSLNLTDALVETFYTIRTTAGASYAELDFEYLPFDIWDNAHGVPNLWIVTWDRTDLSGPNTTTSLLGSCPNSPAPTDYRYVNNNRQARTNHCNWEDWHRLVFQVHPTTKVVTYYVDGEFREEAGVPYYPTAPMNISLANWITERNRSRTQRDYYLAVDWVLYVENQILTPDDMQHLVDQYRAAGTLNLNTTTCQSRSDTFPCSSSATASLNTDALVAGTAESPIVVDNELGPPPQIGRPME